MRRDKKKRIYFRAGFLGLIIALIVFFALSLMPTKTIATSISMQFNGVAKGMYPDNTRFSHLDLVDADILSSIFEYSGIPFDEQYTRAFTVEPVVPANMIENLKKKRAAGEDYTYYPNEFVIKITPDLAEGLSKDMATTVAENYQAAYTEFFKDRFTFPFLDLQSLVDNFNYIDYDYPEYEIVLDNLFNVIVGYLRILEKDAPTFTASNGMNFSGVREGIGLMRSIDLQRISSLVHTYSLTKDFDELIMKYEYTIRQYELNHAMDLRNLEVRTALLGVVENNKATMMLQGLTGEAVGVSVVNKIYDSIATEVTRSEKSAANWTEQIIILKNRINELNGTRFTSVERIRSSKSVEVLSNELYEKIVTWVEMITEMSNEYFAIEYENAITSIYSVREVGGISPMKQLAIAILVWMVSTLLFFSYEKRKVT